MNSSEIIPTHCADFASTFFSSQSSSVLLFEFELPSDSKCFSKLSSGHPMLASRAIHSESISRNLFINSEYLTEAGAYPQIRGKKVQFITESCVFKAETYANFPF